MTNLFPNNTPKWLSLTTAAKQLGVHSATLRRWADNGDIPYLLTPGGHRRFALSDIETFAQAHRQNMMPISVEQVWAEHALDETRKGIVANDKKMWLVVQDEQLREKHRQLGRRLMGLTLQFISDNNDHLLLEAQTIGREYGRLVQTSNLSLTEALQATIFFRDMLIETALQLPESVNVKPEANMHLMRRINQLLNTVHLAIASVYEA